MKNRCNDCGGQYTDDRKRQSRSLCEPCWQNRKWLVTNPQLWITHPDNVRAIQRAMRGGRGSAKAKIEKLKRKLESEAQVGKETKTEN